MPAVKLPSVAPIQATRFAVIGVHHATNTAVRHVGLLAATREFLEPARVDVVHQNPPLVLGPSRTAPAQIQADLVAWLDDIIRRNPDTGRLEIMLSCVGLVTRAYRSARIEIVVDEAERPALGEAELGRVWDLSAWSPRRQRALRAELGTPPFRLLLPGYVLHAFARPTAEARTPYTPSARDLYFPHADAAP